MSLRLVLLLATVVLYFGPTDAALRCRPFYTRFRSRCYRYRGSPALTWVRAEKSCKADGGHLASVHNKGEERFMHTLWRTQRDQHTNTEMMIHFRNERARVPYVYIGLNDRKENGVYRWTDGSKFNYANWMPRNPSNTVRENAVFMWDLRSKGQWNDVIGNDEHLAGAYICKQRLIRD
ncbi:lectin-like protein [Salmonella sp. s51944]|uniref:lectin-like protein n=1 Tax=unclassified Salmonella TaxID=2614656 RepID=UPI00397FC36F